MEFPPMNKTKYEHELITIC
uniref:Uncharacterized protein n=1 Tax=Arundo donax TaxID=35708 RepID=A0A0A9FYD7_ARUDO